MPPGGSSDVKPAAEKQEEHGDNALAVGIRARVKHVTWAWFLSTMSTGGLSIALAETPHRFRGLHTIGLVVFFFETCLFALLCTATLARATFHFQHFKKSFTHPSESFFLGSFLLSISVIIGSIQLYGVTYGPGYPWLISTINTLYWIYAAISLLNSIFQYYILIAHSAARPVPILPSTFLAGYSAMLTGTISSLIAAHQPPGRAMAIIVSGCAYQGFGWLISLICTAFVIKSLLDNGLPPPHLRPALFIPVGAGAYTIVALIGQANAIPESYGYFAIHREAKSVLQAVALFGGIFLWLFSFWIFAIAVVANVSVVRKMPFALTWWAFIFPNVGFTLSTVVIGRELGSEVILWVGSIMTVLLVAVWCATFVGCVRAVWLRRIVWPGKDEDKDR
ncbi:C4-dicarboxylate transporter/malic acid transport protein-like protein [Boeremia exigua]|uniref:C4-dicarboxylate transporter/malic acid transport protein-like protein n=1 Tax=Boeremia exigua TaxID=749465 RepID=UPI001E8D83F2|nr:C4-dicarboxylate transporter/malic acid transport protein-like protein [Boeremia exigua]KAH6614889.1 C4-dicarboxylate transporter/malic acid transport protein-like protein [Boeremia exigua]